jgi:hypothetical protein
MAARTSSHAWLEARASHLVIVDAFRGALAAARPSLEEILSLWPFGRRNGVVLWAKLDTDGSVSIGASLRERALEREPPDVVREVRRIRDDVPVVLERMGVGRVVLPMRELGDARG